MEFSLTKLFRNNNVDLEKLRKINFGEVDAEGRVACLHDCCSKKRKPNCGNGNLYNHTTTHSDGLEFYPHCYVSVKSGLIDDFVEKYILILKLSLYGYNLLLRQINLFLALIMSITENLQSIIQSVKILK